MTDTAYASRQVAAYLRDALFPEDTDDERRGVFTTKGQYTAVLRRDWGLLEEGMDRSFELIAMPEGDERREVARREKKDRSNHWHHAVDAVVIAFSTGSKIDDLAHFVQEQERARADLGYWPKRQRLDPPWGTVEEFRELVLARLKKQIVSHRPVKRKLIGPLHEETLYGPVVAPLPTHRSENPETLFTNRIDAYKLTPNHLRVPEEWDELSHRLETPDLSKSDGKKIRKQLAALEDPSPAKSGIVRDRTLRDRIRKCLRSNSINPDAFSEDDIKRLIDAGKLRTKRRDTKKKGVPILRVVLLRTHAKPVIVSRNRWDHDKHEYVPDNDPRTRRAYIGGNNHHVEILEDTKTRKWSGCVVTAFKAAARVRPPKRSGRTRQPAVDRSDRKGKRFVMSLAEGEMIFMKNPETGEPGYFVLAKLDKKKLHFVAHWDARPATVTKADREKGKSPRDLHSFAPSRLASLGLNEEERPYKVAVSPLGDIRRVND